MLRFDLQKLIYKSVLVGGSILVYDKFVEGNDFLSGYSMSDMYAAVLSTVVSSLTYDVLSSYLPYINEGSLTGMLASPLLNGVIYMYIYNMFVEDKYPNIRSGTNNFVIGSVGSLLVGYLESPVSALFGYRNM